MAESDIAASLPPHHSAEARRDAFGLERNTFLKGGRGLFVENINGTNHTSFLRASPSVMNVKYTAPYGLSGDVPDLQTFATGAVPQPVVGSQVGTLHSGAAQSTGVMAHCPDTHCSVVQALPSVHAVPSA